MSNGTSVKKRNGSIEPLNLEKMHAFKSIGVNRVSFGFQSLHDEILIKCYNITSIGTLRCFIDTFCLINTNGF